MRDLPTRALSLKQPWAHVVIHGPKDVENRSWFSTIRGPFWIAASAQVSKAYYLEACDIISRIAPGTVVPAFDELVLGAIIGRATITDCILPGGYKLDEARFGKSAHVAIHRALVNGGGFAELGGQHPRHPAPWHFLDQYGYLLTDRVAVAKPVPCKGHQRWWTVPAPLLEKLGGDGQLSRVQNLAGVDPASAGLIDMTKDYDQAEAADG